MITKDMERTIVTALDEYSGCVRYSWATKYAIDGMVVFDDRQPICHLSMEEWNEFFSKYETNLIQVTRSTFRFKTYDEMKQGGV